MSSNPIVTIEIDQLDRVTGGVKNPPLIKTNVGGGVSLIQNKPIKSRGFWANEPMFG